MDKLLIRLVRVYQKSNLLSLLPVGSECRFHPSCSEYMIIAIQKYGAFKGVVKGIGRIFRCNPFGKGGVDYP